MNFIHPSAQIHPSADIGFGVWIGPHVCIERNVVIGAYSVIGGHPEHRDFFGQKGYESEMGVVIHEGARLSEMVTIHNGTVHDTLIGPRTAIFQKSHIAHDCELGSDVIIGGNCSLAGHTLIQYHATISGGACTHQWSVMGPYSFLSPGSFLRGHVPPGALWIGSPARPAGANKVGLERAGITIEKCRHDYLAAFEAEANRRSI